MAHPVQPREEICAAVDEAHGLLPNGGFQILHGLGVTLAHEASVDIETEHALGAESPRAEREGDRGVHPTADQEEDVAIAGDPPDVGHDVLDAGTWVPVLFAAALIEDEV